MPSSELPKMNMSTTETGCCPRFEPEPWQDGEFTFQDRLFVKASTFNFLHIPLNMGSVFGRVMKNIKASDAQGEGFLILTDDGSPWRGTHYFAVTKDVKGEEMTRLSGTYLTRVFEGPFRDAPRWYKEMDQHVRAKGKNVQRAYSFFTTCPRCAKHFGKNYVVLFAQI